MQSPVIQSADIYRNGSRCFSYHSDDGNSYEFFIPINSNGESFTQYSEPLLYLNSVNDGDVVHSFTWDEASDFVSGLEFDHPRFHELVAVVNNRGNSIEPNQ